MHVIIQKSAIIIELRKINRKYKSSQRSFRTKKIGIILSASDIILVAIEKKTIS